jgi:hypothetical protein
VALAGQVAGPLPQAQRLGKRRAAPLRAAAAMKGRAGENAS